MGDKSRTHWLFLYVVLTLLLCLCLYHRLFVLITFIKIFNLISFAFLQRPKVIWHRFGLQFSIELITLMLRVGESHGQRFFPCRCVDVVVGLKRTLIRFLVNSFIISILIFSLLFI